jgi:hypothetical protein
MGLAHTLSYRIPRYLLARCLLGSALGGAAAAALAQSPACDQFKETVTERIPAEVRGTLEIAPASTPVPPGAKVVGTCDGGAFRILHYRRGVTPPAEGSTPVAPAAPAASVAVAAPKPAAAKASAPAAAASRPEPAKAVVAAKPPAVKPPEPAASVVAAPVLSAVASAAADARDPPLMPEPPPPAPEGPGLIDSTIDALLAHWPWTLAALLLPLAAWGWSRFSHRRVYDAAGLPRGPKL